MDEVDPTASTRTTGSGFPRPEKNQSIFAKIDANKKFENTTLLIIVINALWICVDVEWNHSRLMKDGKLPLEPVSTVVENLFCFYFTFEVLIRFFAFKTKIFCIFDAWFVFDSVLVTFMVLETWALPIVDHYSSGSGSGGGVLSNFSSFRLLRLLRLTRMARIMRFFPELMTIVKGMVNAMKAVFFILLFLVIVMYVFAIVFTNQLGKPNGGEPEPSDDECEQDATAIMMFASLGSSMMTLFTNGVLGDNLAQTLMAIKATNDGLILMWLFICFMIISSITLLNMLIGVLCQVVDETAAKEEEQQQIYDLQTCFKEAFMSIDSSGDGVISTAEWSKIGSNPDVRHSLLQLGVEPSHLDERLTQMQHTLFGRTMEESAEESPLMSDSRSASQRDALLRAGSNLFASLEKPSKGLSYDEFIGRVVELRWDTPTSALDLEMLKRSVTQENKKIRGRLDNVEAKLLKIVNLLDRGTSEAGGGSSPSGADAAGAKDDASPSGAKAGEQTLALPHTRPETGVQNLPGVVPTPSATVPSAGAPISTGGPKPLNLREVPTELLFHMLKTRSSHTGTEWS